MSNSDNEEEIVENFDWNQLSLECLKVIQSRIGKAIYLKKNEAKSREDSIDHSSIYQYKASLAKVFPSHLRFSLSEYDRCVFLISLGSKNTFIEKLEACVQWIDENFENCLILIGDSLYRLTLEIRKGSKEDTARDEALNFGQEFMEKCRFSFAKYAKKCKLGWILTSELEQRSAFAPYYQQFQKLYRDREPFQKMVDDFAQTYLNRGQPIETNFEKKHLAIAYLLEESALFTCLAEEGWPVFLYPGSIKSFEEIAEGFHPEVPQPLQQMIWASLRLKRQNTINRNIE